MKHLVPLALIPLMALVSSCTLANKLIQAPIRLLQAGVRTVSDAGDTTPPATREATEPYGIALKAGEGAPE